MEKHENENEKEAKRRARPARIVSEKSADLLLILTLTAVSGNVRWFEIKAAGADGRYLLPVFETSDVHGYIAEKAGDDYQYRLAYISIFC